MLLLLTTQWKPMEAEEKRSVRSILVLLSSSPGSFSTCSFTGKLLLTQWLPHAFNPKSLASPIKKVSLGFSLWFLRLCSELSELFSLLCCVVRQKIGSCQKDSLPHSFFKWLLSIWNLWQELQILTVASLHSKWWMTSNEPWHSTLKLSLAWCEETTIMHCLHHEMDWRRSAMSTIR